MANANEPQTLTLIVAADTDAELGVGESEEHGLLGWARKKITAKKDVNLNDVKGQLDKVQGEVDSLLKSIKDTESSGFKLKEVEVGLSVTAEGSIGVATVGGEVSLTLTFAR